MSEPRGNPTGARSTGTRATGTRATGTRATGTRAAGTRAAGTAGSDASHSSSSLLRTSGSIAIATLLSRITGFLRTLLVITTLGAAATSAFTVSNTLPAMISEFVLGAVLTAIVIPVLVRAEREDDDGGAGFINRVFTVSLLVLGAALIVALIAAPLLIGVQLGDSHVDDRLATALAYLLLPQLLFYGMSALFTALLNLKGAFRNGAWAPVVANVVQILSLGVYQLVPGDSDLSPFDPNNPKFWALGVGTTIGIVAQACIQIPALRRNGIRLRIQFGIDQRLKTFGGMAIAIVVYVGISIGGMFVSNHVSAHALESGSGPTIYSYAWMMLQLPYGVIGVTILTAIMPRLSRSAAADDHAGVVADLSVATRLTMIALVPIVVFTTFFGTALGRGLFAYGQVSDEVADALGSALSFSAFTLIPYALVLVHLRVFYARQEAWTPTFIVLGITGVKAVLSLLLPVFVDDGLLVVKLLGFVNGIAYLVGAIIGWMLLQRTMGRIAMTNVTRVSLQTLSVSLVAIGLVWAAMTFGGLERLSTDGGLIGSMVYLVLAAGVSLGLVYTTLAFLGNSDVMAIAAPLRRLLGRFVPALREPVRPDPSPEDSAARMADRVRAQSADYSMTDVTTQIPRVTSVGPFRKFDRDSESWRAVDALELRTMLDAGSVPHPPTLGSKVAPQPFAEAHTMNAPEGGSPVSTNPATPADEIRRGPELTAGALVAGGRYRLISRHGGSRGLQFWRARDVNLERDVALTFVDAEQSAPQENESSRGEGPQSILLRTLRLGRVSSPGLARVFDVVRGSSGGIIVSEWIPSSRLIDVANAHPSAEGSARAVRALADAAEAAHRGGAALSIDHPDRIRVSRDGNAFVAFPGTQSDATNETDVRGLGAVLYALLVREWPLDSSGNLLAPGASGQVGGFSSANFGTDAKLRSPREIDGDIPFEISAVATRALAGDAGIRTAATVRTVLDQASVSDRATEMFGAVTDFDEIEEDDADREPVTFADRFTTPRSLPLLGMAIGAVLLVALVIAGFAVKSLGGGGGDSVSNEQIFGTSAQTTDADGNPVAPSAAGPLTFTDVELLSIESVASSTPDNSRNVGNLILPDPTLPGWTTDTYMAPAFGQLKQGLGLLFTLDSAKTISGGTITSPDSGIEYEIRSSPTANPASLADTTLLASGETTAGETTFTVSAGADVQYVMLWVGSLVQTPYGFTATIDKFAVTGS